MFYEVDELLKVLPLRNQSVTGLVVWKTLMAKLLFQNCFKTYTVQPILITKEMYFGSASSK